MGKPHYAGESVVNPIAMITALLNSPTWEATRLVIDENPWLLSADAAKRLDAILSEAEPSVATDPAAVQFVQILQINIELLRCARAEGTAVAFANLDAIQRRGFAAAATAALLRIRPQDATGADLEEVERVLSWVADEEGSPR